MLTFPRQMQTKWDRHPAYTHSYQHSILHRHCVPMKAIVRCNRSIVRNGFTNNRASSAPNGSERPLRVAMPSACRRLPVAAYIGAATMIPSGILCMAIATAMTQPSPVYAEKATAKPSGMLCRVIVNAMSSPNLQIGTPCYLPIYNIH